jgi:hypothetical protein
MQINMTTFGGRKHHYIHETLQSLFASDWQDTKPPVSLIMGSEDESHVLGYAAHPAVRIVPWDMETDASLRRNCTLNKIRALRHGDDGGMLICEDDILFAPNWFSALRAATAEMGDEEYIMSLSTRRPARLVNGKSLVKQYPTFVLNGAQALFYPTKALRNKVADYLQKYFRRGSCGDHLIGRYARAYAELYAMKEPLVENIGQVSCFH